MPNITPVTAPLPGENLDPWITARNELDEQLKSTANAAAAKADAVEGDLSAFQQAATAQYTELSEATVTNAQNLEGTHATAVEALNLAATKVASLNGANGIWIGTQAQYDALPEKSNAVAYFVLKSA